MLTAFGLSASAGLNAYVPLLIVALAARFTDWIQLASPWDALESWWVIGAIVILGVVEFFADKVPAVNHLNDVIQTFIRPAAGAVLFAASTDVVTGLHPALGIIAGLLVAGSVHVVKSAAIRPAVTATTGGSGNVPVSVAEDVLATILSILAVVVPVLIAALIIVVTAFVVWWIWRRANREQLARGRTE
ncbi:MAG: hypothetical protein A2Z66_12930 [Chloroflexi bacterium RBG_13_66_10]|nr:MAG: hypothetical protein A2Z66_12930 [Chloroflexi bacterium RBG_13_66_10]